MHLRYLKVFCDVVSHRSFSRAAGANNMTQSAVSQAVQHIEEQLGVRLIDRSRRPFVLTPEGKQFHAGCQKILRDFETLCEEIRSSGADLAGTVNIAAIYSIGLSYLPRLQRIANRTYPNVEVKFRFGHPDEVYYQVEQGTVDFGLVSYPESTAHVDATLWMRERMVLVAPPDHPMAAWQEVSPHQLGQAGLVAFAPKLRIRHEIDRCLRQLGVTMRIAAELDNIDSVRHALEVNSAIAFLPEPSVRSDLEDGSLVALNCPWLELERPLGILVRKDGLLSRSARAVLQLIKDSSSELFDASEGQSTSAIADVSNVRTGKNETGTDQRNSMRSAG